MKAFFLSLFSGKDGSASSKRAVLFFLVLLFGIVVLVNLFKGNLIQAELRSDLFSLITISITLVFGEKALDVIKKKKGEDVSPLPPAE